LKDLEKIGSRLDLSDRDIEVLKRERRKWKFILILISVVIAVLSFIIGLLMGWFLKGVDNDNGYPYAVSAASFITISGARPNRWQIILLAFLGFISGLSNPVFGQSVKYGVYGPKGGRS
jgi:hypothetical protein